MPWQVADVDRFRKGLDADEKAQWVAVANSTRTDCLDDGNAEKFCDALAVKAANAALSECWLELAVEGGPGSGNFGHAGIPGQRGGSAPGGNMPAVAQELIEAEEGRISKLDNEVAVMWDTDGNRLPDIQGDSSSVSFTKEQRESLRNGILTHNHPDGAPSDDGFAVYDVILAQEVGLAELRVVCKNGHKHRLRPQEGADWPTEKRIRDRFQEERSKILDEFIDATDERISVLKAEHRTMIWEAVAKTEGLYYSRTAL